MPQMHPLNWTLLFLMTTLMFLSIILNLYFTSNMNPYISSNFKASPSPNSWMW